jgi:hypothetical protein
MMDSYWLLNPDAPGVFIWLILVYLWWSGGWQLATHAFDLEGRERLLVGFGIGLALYLFSANLLARVFPPLINFILSAGVVRLIALVFSLRQERPRLDRRDLPVWPLLLVGAVLGWVFLRISQGLAIFDDYVHLPLISTMAAGNIPPRYFVNSEVNFAYHYGFHLFGASLMRLIGLAPWAAFDLSKAILWPYTILLAWLLGRRITGQRWGGVTFSLLVMFATGTRYLLLLLPARLLVGMDALVNFQGAETSLGGTFAESLLQTWPLDGGPAYSFPFAFINGIGRPLVMSHAGLNILNVAFLLLVWLVISRASRRLTFLALAPLLALWGLTWETSFVLFLGGLFLTAGIFYWREKKIPTGPLRQALFAALLAGVFTLLQGGLITELATRFLSGSGGGGAAAGFGLRWPPAIVSAQLGPLPITSPYGLALAFFELGPVILFTPWITVWAWKKFQERDWLYGVLILSAWIGFVIPVVMTYQSDTDISRISEHAILVWVLLLATILWERAGSDPKIFQYAAGFSLSLMVFGGMVLFGIGLTAAPYGILSYEFDPLDAQVQQVSWDRLPPDSLVFDSRSWRAPTLTGRLTNAVTGDLSFGNVDNPEWEALRETPTLVGFYASGYDFVYIDQSWWNKIPDGSRAALSEPCVATVAAFEDLVTGQFRRLLDLRECTAP